MSRIGKLPIVIPAGVTVTISGNEVKVKGPKGELVQTVSPEIKVEMVDGEIHVTRPNDEKQTRALHGLYRALIHNMVVGVSEGYKKELELVGEVTVHKVKVKCLNFRSVILTPSF